MSRRKKKNSLNRQVSRAYRQNELAEICTLPEEDFGRAFGMQTVEVPQRAWKRHHWWNENAEVPQDYYHFRDNGSHVLAVAHLDTVVPAEQRTPYFCATRNDGPYIRSGALDDRLGAYVILKLLPALGITCDWLLTTGEEDAQSTASFFKTEKDYDWIIEFDWGGTDVVMYQYDNADTRAAVRASGAVVGQGSFSDIAYLEHLGVAAFNWGVGYRGNYHSVDGYAFLNDTFMMTAKFIRFYTQNSGMCMPHVEETSYPAWWDDEEDSVPYANSGSTAGFIDCDNCGSLQAIDPDTLICAYCDVCANCAEDSLHCVCPGGPGVWTVSRAGTPQRVLEETSDGHWEKKDMHPLPVAERTSTETVN